MLYDRGLKADRIAATRAAVAGGAIEIVDAAGLVLVALPIPEDGGTVTTTDDSATWAVGPTSTDAVKDGDAAGAQVRRSAAFGSTVAISGLTVAKRGVGRADVVLDNLTLAKGQHVMLNGFSITHS